MLGGVVLVALCLVRVSRSGPKLPQLTAAALAAWLPPPAPAVASSTHTSSTASTLSDGPHQAVHGQGHQAS